jgi:hypothetical protein
LLKLKKPLVKITMTMEVTKVAATNGKLKEVVQFTVIMVLRVILATLSKSNIIDHLVVGRETLQELTPRQVI